MLIFRSFLLGLKILSSVFERFSESLLALNQFAIFFRSIAKSLPNLFSDLLIISSCMPLAKWQTLHFFYCYTLMPKRKSKCRKTDHFGILHVIVLDVLEVIDAKPLTDKNCLWFPKYESNHLFAGRYIP